MNRARNGSHRVSNGADLQEIVARASTAGRKLRLLARFAYTEGPDASWQPCFFRAIGDEIELTANRKGVADPLDRADREMIISCGTALFRLRLAIEYVGFVPIVHTFPDPLDAKRLAIVRLGSRRRTPDGVESMFVRMKSSAGSMRSAVAGVTHGEEDLPAADCRETCQSIDPAFDAEALERDARLEGVSLERISFDSDDWSGEHVESGNGAPYRPDLLVITTTRDRTPDHLNAGQALERLLLSSLTADLSVCCLNRYLSDDAFRSRLRERIGRWPQVILSSTRPTA